MHLRKEVNYNGKITSFEPLTSAYAQLKINASKDDKWSVHNFAIGDKCGIEVINISKNSFSSSFLPMRQSYSVADPKTRYVDSEKVAVKTLDSVFSQLFTHNDNFLLKIDTQGFESKVLKGAERSLERIGMIQLEMSLTQIYEGESLFNDLYSLLVNKGYELMSIEPGYFNETTGQMLQVDGIFYRYPPANKFTG